MKTYNVKSLLLASLPLHSPEYQKIPQKELRYKNISNRILLDNKPINWLVFPFKPNITGIKKC